MKHWVFLGGFYNKYDEYSEYDTAKYCYSRLSRDIEDEQFNGFYEWLFSLAVL